MEVLILIGASVGGMEALSAIFSALPASMPAPVLAVAHLGARHSVLPEILGKTSALPVRFAEEREPVRPGRILLAPPDRHMLVVSAAGQPCIELTRGPKENHTRPAIDPLFRSAAAAYGRKVVGVILSGYLATARRACKPSRPAAARCWCRSRRRPWRHRCRKAP